MVLDLLSGVRVVSLEQFISAPYCTQILAEAGAEVIKVERPGAGDPRRGYDPFVQLGATEVSGGFASYNRGKRSIELDLHDTEDVARLHELLETADVLVSNLRPGALQRAGLDVPALRERYPSLVICEISGFGTTGGPYADLTAFDTVIQAMSGLSSLLGTGPDDPPQLAPMSTTDLLSGVWAALGIALALSGRQRDGRGSHVDAAMLDTTVALLERSFALHEFTGEDVERGVDRHSPVGTFRAADGRWVALVIPTDEMWARCCAAIGRDDLREDPQLASVLDRAQRMRTHVIPAFEEWASRASLGAAQAVEVLRSHDQPAGVVRSIREVRDDPHLSHRGTYAPLLYRGEDGLLVEAELRLPGLPLLFDGERSDPGPVPELGDFTMDGRETRRGPRPADHTMPSGRSADPSGAGLR